MTKILAHEMIHAFDDCRAGIEWSDCRQHACTEVPCPSPPLYLPRDGQQPLRERLGAPQIRASNLSRECRWLQELRRFNFGSLGMKGHQLCVRRRCEPHPLHTHTTTTTTHTRQTYHFDFKELPASIS